MNEPTLSQLECLLERTRDANVPEDTCHRYALRRALLNSTLFERNRVRIAWTHLFVYATSVMAGSAVVAIVVVGILTVDLSDGARPGPVVASIAHEAVPIPMRLVSFPEHPTVWNVIEFARPGIEFAVSR